jgi:hypothetical protein
MKKDLDFKNFYNSVLIPELEVVEKKRFAILIQLAAAFLVVAGFFGGYVYWFSIVWQSSSLLLLYIPTFALVLLAAYKTYDIIIKNTTFYNYFKNNVIFKTISFINPALRFDKKYFIAKDEFFKSGLFEEQKVKYKGEDYVAGNIEDDVMMEFSELNIRYVDAAKIKEKKTEYLFRGIFYKAKLPFLFPINFVIEPLENSVEKSETSLYKSGNELFDAKFQVRILKRSADYNPSLFLTDEFLKGIVKFAEKYHGDVRISFVDNHIYAAIHHDKELFEPQVFTGNKKFDFVYMHYQDLSFPIHLIQNITLNQQLEELAA